MSDVKYSLFLEQDAGILYSTDEVYCTDECRWVDALHYRGSTHDKVFRGRDSNGVVCLDGYVYLPGSRVPCMSRDCKNIRCYTGHSLARITHFIRNPTGIYLLPVEMWDRMNRNVSMLDVDTCDGEDKACGFFLAADGKVVGSRATSKEAMDYASDMLKAGEVRAVDIFRLHARATVTTEVVFHMQEE